MGLCGLNAPDCTSWRVGGGTPPKLKADPDIAGLGVRLPQLLFIRNLTPWGCLCTKNLVDHSRFSTHKPRGSLLHVRKLGIYHFTWF